MVMKDIIIIAVIVAVLGAAIFYVVKAKKSGNKCIGCPNSKTCSAKNKPHSGSCFEDLNENN